MNVAVDTLVIKLQCTSLSYLPSRQYNKVMLYSDPLTRAVTAMPCMWPATQADNWVMAKAEIYARDIKTPDDLKVFIGRKHVELARLILKAGIPDHYKHHTFDLKLKHMFDGKWGPGCLDKVMAEGFWGGQWKPAAKGKVQVFSDWENLAMLVASLMAGEVASRL